MFNLQHTCQYYHTATVCLARNSDISFPMCSHQKTKQQRKISQLHKNVEDDFCEVIETRFGACTEVTSNSRTACISNDANTVGAFLVTHPRAFFVGGYSGKKNIKVSDRRYCRQCGSTGDFCTNSSPPEYQAYASSAKAKHAPRHEDTAGSAGGGGVRANWRDRAVAEWSRRT